MPIDDSLCELIKQRHPEWLEHQLRWRWMLDSLEGGERYRQATYGFDRRGLPIRNLIRHKREYPDPRDVGGLDWNHGPEQSAIFRETSLGGRDPAALATDDDYELRRARTPIPTFLSETVETHLSRIFAREVTRSGTDRITDWWSNVDGCGTTVDQWMTETVAPLLLTLGQLDILMDHPLAPHGEQLETRADVERLGLDRCVASYILPENMLWWKLDETGHRYEECLVLEFHEIENIATPFYRYWTEKDATLVAEDGSILEINPHPFGRVPIVRIFDRRKPRCKNIGQSRYEGVAERQREYYNRDSELILSDTTQAHPLLQGPEDFVQADGTIPIGPSWLLPKKKNTSGGTSTYEGFDVVNFPKDAAESIRKNKADIRDDVDRDSALVRPSKRDGSHQSGFSKAMDYVDGNNRLSKIAKILERAECVIAHLAALILSDGETNANLHHRVAINYPGEFDLFTATDVGTVTAEFQSIVSKAGALPLTEGLMMSRLLRFCLPGLSDAQYSACDEEIRSYMNQLSSDRHE